mmetsp:Transcript_53063/g.123512  ORF Transcript_53063/g.123512 Transcript_53063/m.123512 type:complete len:323 (-) Transcript_53063:91-1059(-)
MQRAWDLLLNRSRLVSPADFEDAAAELGYSKSEAQKLYEQLCLKPSSRFLALHDVVFLQAWEDAKQGAKAHARLSRRWVNKDPFINPGSGEGPHAAAAEAVGGSWPLHSMSPRSYAGRVATDSEDLWENFKMFLVERFKTLPDAWDAMDINGKGLLWLREFQAVLTNNLNYCRASEAKRLFNLARADHEPLTWKDLGVGEQQWIEHTTEKLHRLRSMKPKSTTLRLTKKEQCSRSATPQEASTKRSRPTSAQEMLRPARSCVSSQAGVTSRPPRPHSACARAPTRSAWPAPPAPPPPEVPTAAVAGRPTSAYARPLPEVTSP